MIKKEIGIVELPRTVDQSAWRHFWLTNVMIERGKPLPAKNARSTMRATYKSLTRRAVTPTAVSIQHIADALVAAGYTSLDKQAKALGIHRATAWTIVKKKHKLGRLNTNTTIRMLANPELPPPVRAILQQYLAERFDALPKSLTDD